MILGSHFIHLALKSSAAIAGQVQTSAPMDHMEQSQVKIDVVSMAGEVLCPMPTENSQTWDWTARNLSQSIALQGHSDLTSTTRSSAVKAVLPFSNLESVG